MGENQNNKTKLHEGRADLTGEYRWGDLGQLILFFIFTAVWITDSFFTGATTFLADAVPLFVRLIIAAPILIVSFLISRKGLNIVFGEVRETPSVLKAGVFALVRHPIYLGAILFYLGLIITSFSLISFGIWMIIIIYYYFISRYEEKILVDRFGDEYRNYMKEVPMLVPKIFRL